MKKRENYWKRVEQTGDVMDYLNYTACARESYGIPEEEEEAGYERLHNRYSDNDDDEVEDDERDAYREWDGSIGNADGRIR